MGMCSVRIDAALKIQLVLLSVEGSRASISLGMKRERNGPTQSGGPESGRPRDCIAARADLVTTGIRAGKGDPTE